MMPAWIRAAGCMVAACCVLAGCNRGSRADQAATETGSPLDSIAGDSLFVAPPEQPTLPRDRIYYTLTMHEWYARGEPLVHDGRRHMPVGMPVQASLDVMERAGEFQGVEYYVRADDNRPAVYVPVFPGYWQTFRADASAAAMPAVDVPPEPVPADADSSSSRD